MTRSAVFACHMYLFHAPSFRAAWCKKASSSALIWSFSLEHMPCGRRERSWSLAPSQAWAESSAGSITQHSPAFRDEGRELALKPLSCTAAPAVSDGR